uniref:probable methionine--tRNA ligase n=1 Tax=Erigeron canadensis TaxID=72917 RepID=UPI001CB8B8E2|nr:probable methionine--tRNA ligase [Erigeron canadensis]
MGDVTTSAGDGDNRPKTPKLPVPGKRNILITSALPCYTPEWEAWWKNPENVELYQFMGKDNVPFYTIMFPSTLIGTAKSWTMMKTISVSDTLFTWADLQMKLKKELKNNLGNFIYRVLSFIAHDPESVKGKGLGYNSLIPDAPDAESHALTKGLADKIGNYADQYVEAMEKVMLMTACQFWKLYKEDLLSCSMVMRTSVGVVYLLACLLEPFMPSFSLQVLKQLNMSVDELSLSDDEGGVLKGKTLWEIIPVGHRIGTPNKDLFSELMDDELVKLRKSLLEVKLIVLVRL